MKRIVAITGGIGAGKSVVSHALRVLGCQVYDCDSAARLLMDSSSQIKQEIAGKIAPEVINIDGTINRKLLSDIVFSDASRLVQLNEIVHGAVRGDFLNWVAGNGSDILFVETAILYESGFDKLVGEVWEVTAPEQLRVERVIKRSGLTADEIRRRIDSQSSVVRPGHAVIINDDVHPIIPQLLNLLS